MGELIGLVAVAAPFLFAGYVIWIKQQGRLMEQRSGLDDREVRQLVNQVETLQDRVQVLERIVTDQGYSVASQIEALRDPGRSGKGIADRRGEQVG
jgi:hypothetical protein